MFLAGPPEEEIAVPGLVREATVGETASVVWVNQLGGLTFEVHGPRHRFLKFAPRGSTLDLRAEAERLSWAAPFTPVPRVIDLTSGDEGTLLATSPLPGTTAVDDLWKREPSVAVRAIGAGLRAMHDVLPVAACPFTWSVEDRVAHARVRAREEDDYRDHWHPSHRHRSVDDALHALADPPPIDREVVCHGDACAPNTLILDGEWSGHVDLGALGVADRWADLAVAAWSTEWNYGPGWTDPLLDAYGIEADAERLGFYRLLWDLS